MRDFRRRLFENLNRTRVVFDINRRGISVTVRHDVQPVCEGRVSVGRLRICRHDVGAFVSIISDQTVVDIVETAEFSRPIDTGGKKPAMGVHF